MRRIECARPSFNIVPTMPSGGTPSRKLIVASGDRARHADRRLHNHRLNYVRQNVAGQNPQIGGSQRAAASTYSFSLAASPCALAKRA
jgi:hypothetical protein